MNGLMSLQPLDFGAWLWVGAAIAAFAFGGWVLSLWRNNVGIVDVMWSLMFVLALVVYLAVNGAGGWRAWFVTAMVAAWALRLAGHIAWRNHGQPEDRRYREIRRNNEPGFRFKSLYLVFALQGFLAWVIVLPVLAAVNGQASPGPLDLVAVTVWLTGMAFEVVGDAQLARFRADPAHRGQVLDRGLWRYTRHPNYFGECLIWWGFYLLALPAGGAWTLFAPVLMTILLLRVSGVALLEKDIGERRPGYRRYIESTNAFWPGPPRRPAGGPRGSTLALTLFGLLLVSEPLRIAASEPTDGNAGEPDRQWRFRVFVDDREVGYHHFYLDEEGERRVLRSVAEFEYRLLFVTLYQYQHENHEVWDGDCLARIESRTDANGKPYAVAGERRENAFLVSGAKGEQVLPECVMSFAYWNPAFLEAGQLLNTQNGEYLDVRVSGPVRDEIATPASKRSAWRYRLEAGKLELELWYSDQREWLGLRTRYENGRTLRYERIDEPRAPDGAVAGL